MSETGIVYKVPKALYDELMADHKMLIALQSAGVDNWDGYDIALELLEQWEKEDADAAALKEADEVGGVILGAEDPENDGLLDGE